ncbi:MAG TPA: ABC transporter ATP-binding protein [Methylomirabilota bacterium]|nr:ABC transporter ATP-binding protein [Methylomirabilota bacterium]
MSLLHAFVRDNPGRSTLVLVALLFGALAEGLGLSALLPLLGAALEGNQAGRSDGIGRVVVDGLRLLGVEATSGALLVMIVAAVTVKNGLALLANRQAGYAVAQVATDLRLALVRALLGARWEYYARQPVGAVANSVATEAARAASAYLSATALLALGIQALVYAVVAFLVSWKVTLTALVAGLAFTWAVRGLVHAARRAGARQTVLLRALLAHLTDTLQSVKALKAMAREASAGALLGAETVKLNRALQRDVLSREALKAFQEPAITALIAVGLYVALTRLTLPLPSLTVLVFVLGRLLVQLGRMQRLYQQMVAFESAYWALRDMIRQAERASEPPLGSTAPRLEHAISVERVSFAYDGAPVLQNVSLTIPAGSFTTLMGPSGAGKTTLVDLLTALLRPDAGEIHIDGVALGAIDRRGWRRLIGYVPQDTLLLNDTILANVTLGDPALTATDAERALRAAGAWEFVAASPDGLLTLAGERGARLSGGQRQRLAIARALAHRPRLLVLDEATSALDGPSEAQICDTLRALCGEGLTVLAVSHRPALAAAADRVYRVDEGGVTPVAPAPGWTDGALAYSNLDKG